MKDRPKGWDWKQELKRLRSQMLIHSCLYYELNETVIDDHTWQRWANNLAKLQNFLQSKGVTYNIQWYDEAFVGWDGSTGYHLPRDGWIIGKCYQLLRYRENVR